MRTRIAFLSILCLPAWANAVPELSGVVLSPDSAMFALTEPESGESSGWIRIGSEFCGYRVVEYRNQTGTLVLLKDGAMQEIGLRSATIVDSRSNMPEASLPKIEFAGKGKLRIGDQEIALDDLAHLLKTNQISIPQVEVVAQPKTDTAEVCMLLSALRCAGITGIRLKTAE